MIPLLGSKIHLFKYHEVFNTTTLNSMIQSLNGWNNITWQALLQETSFNPSVCLLRSSVQTRTHPQEASKVFLKSGIHQIGKHVYWVKVVTRIFSHRKDLPSRVQVSQVFVFFFAHHFLSILIVHIFVDVGWE